MSFFFCELIGESLDFIRVFLNFGRMVFGLRFCGDGDDLVIGVFVGGLWMLVWRFFVVVNDWDRI